jgi:hypothetical protein
VISSSKQIGGNLRGPGFSGRMTGPMEESSSLDEITLSRLIRNVFSKCKFVGR